MFFAHILRSIRIYAVMHIDILCFMAVLCGLCPKPVVAFGLSIMYQFSFVYFQIVSVYCVADHTLWNVLPKQIRKSSSLENFKSSFKTYLFMFAFFC